MPDWGGTDLLGASSKGGTATLTQSNPAIDYLNQLLAGSGATATTQATTNPATQPPPNRSSPPPVPGDFYSGTANHYVDPTYRTDAYGNPLTPEQQAAARAADTAKAQQAAARGSRSGSGGSSTAKTTGNAVYDDITGTWSILKPDGTWANGVKQADLQAQLPDNLKQQYPDWWWGQYASQQDLARRQEVDAGAYDAQRFAQMGQQSTHYAATNF